MKTSFNKKVATILAVFDLKRYSMDKMAETMFDSNHKCFYCKKKVEETDNFLFLPVSKGFFHVGCKKENDKMGNR